MKAVYKAVRNILYPQGYSPIAGAKFAEGSHWFALQHAYPFLLCQELMDFEQANRGHRHLLNFPSLHADSTDLLIPCDARRSVTVRRTVKGSMYWLFRRVIDLGTVPNGEAFQHLLDANDELGYFRSFVYEELTKLCEKQLRPLLEMGVHVARTRVESGIDPVLHVRVELSMTGRVAKRAIPLAMSNVTSLGDARTFLRDSEHRILEALGTEMAQWPEFGEPPKLPNVLGVHKRTTSAEVPTEENAKGFQLHPERLYALAQAPMPTESDIARVLGMRSDFNPMGSLLREAVHGAPDLQAPASSEFPSSDEVDAQMEAHQVLLDRLQRHMQDFLSMYTPAVQEILADNWEQFRPTVIKG